MMKARSGLLVDACRRIMAKKNYRNTTSSSGVEQSSSSKKEWIDQFGRRLEDFQAQLSNHDRLYMSLFALNAVVFGHVTF